MKNVLYTLEIPCNFLRGNEFKKFTISGFDRRV
jgi:hypothetical protein